MDAPAKMPFRKKLHMYLWQVQHEVIIKVDMAHTGFTIWNLVKGI